MLTYPHEFVKRVEEEYSVRPDVLFLARENRYMLGRLLADGAASRMSPEEIVAALERGDHGAVLSDASSAVRRRQLHAEWMRIVLREISCVQERVSSSRWRAPPSIRGSSRLSRPSRTMPPAARPSSHSGA